MNMIYIYLIPNDILNKDFIKRKKSFKRYGSKTHHFNKRPITK